MTNSKPILFKTDMVKAILSGQKTITRRIIKPQPQLMIPQISVYGLPIKGMMELQNTCCPISSDNFIKDYCKYQKGMELWVRETFMYETEQGIKTGGYIYKATDNPIPDNCEKLKWKPSIFMPRAASRITLIVKDVRVERIQEITTNDIRYEGVSISDLRQQSGELYLHKWIELWDSINKSRGFSWESNPYVYVISFKVKK